MDSPPFRPCSASIRRERRGGAPGAGAGPLRRAALVLGLALALLPAGLAGSAFAAVAAHEMRDADSASNSTSPKSVTASCPGGKQVLGAGAAKTPTTGGQVLLEDISPSSNLTSVTVKALEDQTLFSGGWSVSARAICASPPVGLQRLTATSASNSTRSKSVTATCPGAKRVLGVGAELNAGNGQVVLDDLRPNESLTSLTVTGIEDGNGYSGSWSVTAIAICASPPAGLERVDAARVASSSDKSVAATCPAGKRLLGAGGELTGGGGQVVFEPNPFPADPTAVNVGAFEDESGFAGNWSVTAYAICAAVSRLVVVATGSDSPGSKGASASCPSGLQTTGLGGDITGGAGQVALNSVSPIGTTEVSASAHEDETGFAGNWTVRALAICATPLPGLTHLYVPSPEGSQTEQAVQADCPAGKQLVGAGGAISFRSSSLRQVMLEEIVPNLSLTGVFVSAVEDPNGTDGFWSMYGVAVCANRPAGLQLVQAGSFPDQDPASVTATCPAGKNVLGGGAELVFEDGRVVLDDIRPDQFLRSVTATGVPGEYGTLGPWTVTAYAICANP